MSTPAVTRECTPGSCCNSRKTMKLPPRCEMRPDSPALHAEQCLVPNQTGKEPWFDLRNYREFPRIPHKSRMTLMSPQECEISRCSPYQLEMMTNSRALASEQCPIPHHTWQLVWVHLGNPRDSLGHTSQVYRNTNFSTGTQGKLHLSHIISRRELIPSILLKR